MAWNAHNKEHGLDFVPSRFTQHWAVEKRRLWKLEHEFELKIHLGKYVLMEELIFNS